jgi:phosphate starvation-inducible protein PhoH
MAKKTKRTTINKEKLVAKDIRRIKPLTDNQAEAIRAFTENKNLLLTGSAGTGKTYIALALALRQTLNRANSPSKVMIVRSAVPTREIGFLPGSLDEKIEIYYAPYEDIVNDLSPGGWDKAIGMNLIKLESTSFIRGSTWDDVIVIVDEIQNMSFHELDSVITRLGINSRVIFCGDYYQSDLLKEKERDGVRDFVSILKKISNFTHIEFTSEDIVRSDLVREYIIAKEATLQLPV